MRCWKIGQYIASYVASRTSRNLLAFLMLFICALSLFLTYDTAMDTWQSQARVDLFVIRNILNDNRILFVNKTKTSLKPMLTTTTVSPIDTDKAIRRLLDNRSRAFGYKSGRRHPHLRKLLISSEDVCRGMPVDLLIYFNSAWYNFQRRRILRETWANTNTFHNLTVRRIFFLGKPKSGSDQIKIQNEVASYGDIVQGDFFDSFGNLSMKALTCFKWINDYCMNAKYIIKADDDIFVNVFKIFEDILPMLSSKTPTVACHFKKNGTSVVVRNPKSKWFVPKEVFPGWKYLPDFCTGYVAIFTSDVIPKMYEASFSVPFISVDDVYMFGLLPQFFKSLHYIDIQRNCSLNSKIALNQYMHSTSAITYVVTNAWEAGAMQAYWLAALSKLSPWAARQARITNLRKNKKTDTL